MTVNWDKLAEQTEGAYVSADFERAGYRLMVQQVLYASDRLSRGPYQLIVKYFAAYREAFSYFGMEIHHNPHHSYLVAIPNHNVAEKMLMDETRLALVLRRLYDDRMQLAEIRDGEAVISLEELERAYKEWLSRELPERSALRELVNALKRYGFLKVPDAEDGQPFKLVIRPGIVELLGEAALHQLAAHSPETDEETDHETA